MDEQRGVYLEVYIGTISPLPPPVAVPLSPPFQLPLIPFSTFPVPPSVSASADWQGFAISVTRSVTNFDLHNWQNTLRRFSKGLGHLPFYYFIFFISLVPRVRNRSPVSTNFDTLKSFSVGFLMPFSFDVFRDREGKAKCKNYFYSFYG